MSDCPIETADEGGDPACWAHLFDDEGPVRDVTPNDSADQRPAISGCLGPGRVAGDHTVVVEPQQFDHIVDV